MIKKTNLACLISMLSLSVSTLQAVAADLPQNFKQDQVDPSLKREQMEDIRRQEQIEQRAGQTQIPALQGDDVEENYLVDDGNKFTLSGIRFNASKLLSKDLLESIARDYVGREIGFSDLNQLLAKINALYAKAGQVTARAIILPQNMNEGLLRIVLIEAKVDKIIINSEQKRHVDDAFYYDRIDAQLGETLDVTALINSIHRLNATTPGPQVSAGLAKGEDFGTTQVYLNVYEPTPLKWTLFANNNGSPSTGRVQRGGMLSWFSPTGVADALSMTAVKTNGSEYYNLRYSRPLNSSNGVAYVGFDKNYLKIVQGDFVSLDIAGSSTSYSLGFDQPWWVNPNWMLQLGTGYNKQSSENTLAGQGLTEFNSDEVFLRGQAEYRSSTWYLMYEQRLRQAKVDNVLTKEIDSYHVYNGRGYFRRSLSDQLSANMQLGWQAVDDPISLPSTLNYQLGGISSVRGYDPGAVTAPEGVNVKFEAAWQARDNVQPFVFYDYGATHNLGVKEVQIASVGAGLNLSLGKYFSMSLIAASTLNKISDNQAKNQLMAQFFISN
jgi:hemolysin activation/secretion protein